MKKILQRFVDIWKLDFLAMFFAGEKRNNKTTIGFFLFSSMLLTIFVAAAFFILVFTNSNELVTKINENIVDDVRVTMSDGNITIDNLSQPFLRELKVDSNSGNRFDQNIVIAIDTKNKSYDESVLNDYNGGVVILSDHMIVKNAIQIQKMQFSDMTNFTISRNEIVSFIKDGGKFGLLIFQIASVVALITFIYLTIFRSIFAFWWALMLFVMMRIYEIDESYKVAYKAILNLYFIPSIVLIILLLFGINVPLITTIIFVTLFIMNLIWIKKQPEISKDKIVKLTPEQLLEKEASTKTTKK